MGDPRGFLKLGRQKDKDRPVDARVQDWNELVIPAADDDLRAQASRCMDCGIPFCHQGCPLGNLIPEWNDLVHTGRNAEAVESLHSTNNFPEVTSRVCPAPCEAACVLNIHGAPVTIKSVERAIADLAFSKELEPVLASHRSGAKVAVVGSGPAGLAAAQQLARAGHDVTVFERDDRLGGLLRYGIPDFKMEKTLLDRRLAQIRSEGVELMTGVDAGRDLGGDALRAKFDAVILAAG
ncbi:MAG: FAD-dependent oxidoreductase, partial [Polyangiaceae bacterium]